MRAVASADVRPPRRLLPAVGEQDRELVATEASHDVGAADGPPQQARDGDQELVAGVVAEGVVDLLEVVEVEQEERSGGAVATAEVEVALELVLEAPAVGEAGQHVVVHQVGQPVEVASPVGDVHDVDHDDLAHAPVADDGAAERHAHVVAAGVAQRALQVEALAGAREQAAQVVLDPALPRRLEVGELMTHHLGGIETDDDRHRDVDPDDLAVQVEQGDPVRCVVEEPLDPLTGDDGAAALALQVADDALEDRCDDEGDGGPHHRPAPVADRVGGRADDHGRHGERQDGQRARHPQLPEGAGDRQPQDGQQEEDGHAGRGAAGAGSRGVVEQTGVGEEQVGGGGVEPRALAPAPVGEVDARDRAQGEGREPGHPPGALVGRQRDDQQADGGHQREGDGECGRAPAQIGCGGPSRGGPRDATSHAPTLEEARATRGGISPRRRGRRRLAGGPPRSPRACGRTGTGAPPGSPSPAATGPCRW